MATYIVMLERTIVQSARVEIEASNADLAAANAELWVNNQLNGEPSKLPEIDWELESDSAEVTEDPYTEDSDNA